MRGEESDVLFSADFFEFVGFFLREWLRAPAAGIFHEALHGVQAVTVGDVESSCGEAFCDGGVVAEKQGFRI